MHELITGNFKSYKIEHARIKSIKEVLKVSSTFYFTLKGQHHHSLTVDDKVMIGNYHWFSFTFVPVS